MRNFLSISLIIPALSILVLMLLAAPSMAATAGIPGDADKNNELTKAELSSLTMSYLSGSASLDDVKAAALVYTHWDGKPLTVKDSINVTTTFYRPPEKIISVGGSYGALAIIALGKGNNLAGVADYAGKPLEMSSYLADVPSMGGSSAPDVEKMLSRSPDVVVAYALYNLSAQRSVMNMAGVPMVQFDFYKPESEAREVTTMGKILCVEDTAANWSHSRRNTTT